MTNLDRTDDEHYGTAITDRDTEPCLNGPPETVVKPDDSRMVIIPNGDTHHASPPMKSVTLGSWKCQRCGSVTDLGLDCNGELKEPYECSGCERQGPFVHAGELTDETIQSAMVAGTEWVVPPTAVTDERIGELWNDIRSYISKFWKAKNDQDYDLLTAWVITTWLRPNLRTSAHLLVMGKTNAGKTRMLNTLSRLSYRGGVTADTTPAALFRHIDTYDSTQFISEYHGLSPDARQQVNNIVRAGQKRDEFIRRAKESSVGGYQASSYNPFSHVAIASQYSPPDDIKNRCIRLNTRSGNAPDLPDVTTDAKAKDISNRLLFVRWDLLGSDEFEDAFTEADAYCRENNVHGRTKEKVRPLLAVAILWGEQDEFEPVIEWMVESDEQAAEDSEDANIIAAIRNLSSRKLAESSVVLGKDEDVWATMEIPYSDIVREYNNMTGENRGNKWLGHALKRLDFGKKRKRDGMVLNDVDLKSKLERFCEMYGFELYDSDDIHHPVKEMPEEDHYKGDCSECGDRLLLTMKHIEGETLCHKCATSYTERRET